VVCAAAEEEVAEEEAKIEAEVAEVEAVQEGNGSDANEAKVRLEETVMVREEAAASEDVDVVAVPRTGMRSEVVEAAVEVLLDLKAEAFPPLPVLEKLKTGSLSESRYVESSIRSFFLNLACYQYQLRQRL
jgi:hypothetical protein